MGGQTKTGENSTFKGSQSTKESLGKTLGLTCDHPKRNGKVEYFVDNHELGLFDTNRTLQYMKDAGLKCKYLKNGLMKDRGLFIGVKE